MEKKIENCAFYERLKKLCAEAEQATIAEILKQYGEDKNVYIGDSGDAAYSHTYADDEMITEFRVTYIKAESYTTTNGEKKHQLIYTCREEEEEVEDDYNWDCFLNSDCFETDVIDAYYALMSI